MGRGAKEPLYRKVNTTAHGVSHQHGGDYRDRRPGGREIGDETQASMGARKRRGLDYTPLFRFLLSRVGRPWAETYQQAVARLDREEPIFWLVAERPEEAREIVRVGESSYFSGLYVGDDGLLHRTNPALDETMLEPSCRCCTHTLNGLRFTQSYVAPGGA